MNETIIDQLGEQLRMIRQLLKKADKQCKELSDGDIWFRKRGDKSLAFVKCKGKPDHYLSRRKQGGIMKSLCQKRYLERLMPVLEDEINVLQKFINDFHPEDKYGVVNCVPAEYMELINPLILSNAEQGKVWQEEPYIHNGFTFKDPNQYVTRRGESVRSRLELIVADILYYLGIPYRYECELRLNDGVVYPDFTIYNVKTGQVEYIELFGMMDFEDYQRDAFRKIQRYYEAGYSDRLLMFFDTSGYHLSSTMIENVLRERYCIA